MGRFFKQETVIANPVSVPGPVIANPEGMKQSQAFEVKQTQTFEVKQSETFEVKQSETSAAND